MRAGALAAAAAVLATLMPAARGTHAQDDCNEYSHVELGLACITTCYIRLVPDVLHVCLYRNFECSNGHVARLILTTSEFASRIVPGLTLWSDCEEEHVDCRAAAGPGAAYNVYVCREFIP